VSPSVGEQRAGGEPAPRRRWRSAPDWRAAALLGLLTSTFSTVAVTLGSARIGRDVVVDWMMVGTILLRDQALRAEPGWIELGVGILVHQSADFFWALVFFGLLGRWTGWLTPWTLLLLAAPWAALTSAVEYYLVLPWVQPLFVMQQPYWAGLAVHLISSSLYPLYPWLRDRSAGMPSPWRGFAGTWGLLAAGGLAALAVLAWLGSRDREVPRLPLGGEVADRRFLRMMTFHHEAGVALARQAAVEAANPELRSLARLMVADQSGETVIMRRWWRSWFDPVMPPPSPEEHAAMPGMPGPMELARLDAAAGTEFDRGFVAAMSRHHAGAIAMAGEALARAADPRVWLIADGIRHAQRKQVAVMAELVSGHGMEVPLPPGQTPATHGPHAGDAGGGRTLDGGGAPT
jgi:uncharacterized protein (DUF305 family)